MRLSALRVGEDLPKRNAVSIKNPELIVGGALEVMGEAFLRGLVLAAGAWRLGFGV